MAYFAELNENNIVINTIVIDDNDTQDVNGNSSEIIGIAHCKKKYGVNTNWKQFYRDGRRGNRAGIGVTYVTNVATLGVGSTDIFIGQQLYGSWTISTTEADWVPPANPGDAPALTDDERAAGKYYAWNESNYQADPATAWVLTTP